MALKNAFRANLTIDGIQVGNTYWDAFMGGKYTQSETKYTAFDGVQRTYVGLKSTENITVEANYEANVHGSLLGGPADANDKRGHEAVVTVFDIVNGNFVQNRAPYKGLVLDIVPPDGDSNDAGTITKIQVVVSVGILTAS